MWTTPEALPSLLLLSPILVGQFLAGLIGGFGGRLRERQEQQAKEEADRRKLELDILSKLAFDPTGDPRARTMALSAMVQQVGPKPPTRLFDKLFSAAQASPVTGTLQGLIEQSLAAERGGGTTPQPGATGPPTAGGTPGARPVALRPPPGTAALPARSSVEGGPAPAAAPPARPAAAPGVPAGAQAGTPPPRGPRVFLEPPPELSPFEEAFQSRSGTLAANQLFPEADEGAAAGSLADIVRRREGELGRPLTSDEAIQTKRAYESAAAGESPRMLAEIAAGSWDVLQSLSSDLRGPVLDVIANDPALREQFDATMAARVAPSSQAQALAEMAADSWEVLQGPNMTPTMRGDVLAVIAADPELHAKFDRNRLLPAREQAKVMLTAIDDLVAIEPGAELLSAEQILNQGRAALTPGGAAAFGENVLPQTRGVQAFLQSMWPGGVTPSEATRATSAVAQLIGQRVLAVIGDMKRQSGTGATGFGQLSNAELLILEAAASRLTQRVDEATALRELVTIREKFAKILQPSASEQEAGLPVEGAAAAVPRRTPMPTPGSLPPGVDPLDLPVWQQNGQVVFGAGGP